MLKEQLHWTYRSVTLQIKEIGRELFPRGRSEIIILLVLFFFYLSYALYYGFETAIVTHSSRKYDLYFSFDNVVTFLRGYPNLGRYPFF